ncbi:MAG: hypothetical protein ACFE96_07085 [Candidatus Hermodarchaeota archaeon]
MILIISVKILGGNKKKQLEKYAMVETKDEIMTESDDIRILVTICQ